MHLEPRLLKQIFRKGAISGVPEKEAVDTRGVPLEQRLERALVAILVALHQCLIAQRLSPQCDTAHWLFGHCLIARPIPRGMRGDRWR